MEGGDRFYHYTRIRVRRKNMVMHVSQEHTLEGGDEGWPNLYPQVENYGKNKQEPG